MLKICVNIIEIRLHKINQCYQSMVNLKRKKRTSVNKEGKKSRDYDTLQTFKV